MECPDKNMVFVSPFNETLLPTAPPMKCKWSRNIPEPCSPHTRTKRLSPQKTSDDVFDLIGNTPMVKLNKIPQSAGLKCNVYAKCEFLNPTGSLKDRIVKRMIEDAENQGLLRPGYTIIEPSSGNTGISIAMAAAVKGYSCIIVMPEKMSLEKEWMMTALGAKVVRTPITVTNHYGPEGIFGVAHRLRQEIPNSLILDQFYNPGNPLAHYDNTAEEILEQLDGKIDMIVMGAGTGGALTGLGRKIKEVSPQTQIIGVDPEGSMYARPEYLNKTDVTGWEVEGLGYYVITPTLDQNVVDKWYKSNDRDTMIMARRIIAEEGLFCGGSSGALLSIALEAAKDLTEGKNLVVLLPDGIRNYMTKLLSLNWMEAKTFLPPVNDKNHWWWDINVLSMKPKSVPIISTETTCDEAQEKIEQPGVNIAVIVQENGHILGALTPQYLSNQLISGNVNGGDTVERVAIRIYHRANKAATLGLISRILEIGPYVVIYDQEEVGATKIEKLIGVVESPDLLSYIKLHQPK